MKGFHAFAFLVVALVLTASHPTLSHAQQQESFVANVEIADEVITFHPDDIYVAFTMQVAGPADFYLQQRFEGDQTPSLHLRPEAFADGSYKMRLTAQPFIPETSRAALEEARAQNDRATLARLQRQAGLNAEAMVYTMNFGVAEGKFINPREGQDEPSPADTQTGAASPPPGAPSSVGEDAMGSFSAAALTGRRWDATGTPGQFVAAPDVTGTAPLQSAFLTEAEEALPFQVGTPTASWYEASFEQSSSDGAAKAYEGYLRPLVVNGERMLIQAYVREAGSEGTWIKGFFRSEGEGFQFIDLATAEAQAASRPAPLFDYVTGEEQPVDPLDAAMRAQVFTQDVVVQSSLCVGFDCPSAPSFGADTIRLQENNLRIHFDDTSNSGSFPNNDWRLVANETINGGRNYWGVEDASAGRTPLWIEAGSPNFMLYVDASERIGFGTNAPAVQLHNVEGNTPTLRLEQDGSSGFAPQTWDIASNEANFFVRDVTNGSRLVFRIKPGAPGDALFIAADGDIGMGTDAPDASTSLHIIANTGAGDDVIKMENNGPTRFSLENTNSPITNKIWRFNHDNAGDLRIAADDGDVELTIEYDTNNMTILGDYFSATCTNPGSPCAPDYVFDESYGLLSLAELDAYIKEHKHLPNVPSEDDLRAAGVINHSAFQMTLLEKIEELTLYTLEQQKTLEELQVRLKTLETSSAARDAKQGKKSAQE